MSLSWKFLATLSRQKKIPARSLFAQENISHATNLACVAGGIVSVRD